MAATVELYLGTRVSETKYFYWTLLHLFKFCYLFSLLETHCTYFHFIIDIDYNHSLRWMFVHVQTTWNVCNLTASLSEYIHKDNTGCRLVRRTEWSRKTAV